MSYELIPKHQKEEANQNSPAKRKSETEQKPSKSYDNPICFSMMMDGVPPPDIPLTPHNVRYWHRTIGNQAVRRIVQTKLKVGKPDDKYERQADQIADAVMRMQEPDSQSKTIRPFADNSSLSSTDEELPGKPHLKGIKSGGQPLPESLRTFFETRFGSDFSQVRLHNNAQADETVHSLNARAFTLGRNIVFGRGQYTPQTRKGRQLLAHELTHVIQQSPNDNHLGQTIRRVPDDAGQIPTGTETEAGRATPLSGLIVEDSVTEPGEGRMRKSAFLEEARNEVCRVVEPVIAPTGRTTDGCPYLVFVFRFLSGRSAHYIDQILAPLASEGSIVTRARDYIPIITERVRQSAQVWMRTGEITGLPEGIPSSLLAGALGAGSASRESVQFKAKAGGAELSQSPQTIQHQLGPGRSLEGSVRSRMSGAFGHDFSKVRIHTDSKAGAFTNQFNARAFTVGEHVAFGSGEYKPGTLIGDALIAHEMAHVVQQDDGSASSVIPMKQGDTSCNNLEQDADNSAVLAVLSLWGKAKGRLAEVARNARPRLRSGLRLSRCHPTWNGFTILSYTNTYVQKVKNDLDALNKSTQGKNLFNEFTKNSWSIDIKDNPTSFHPGLGIGTPEIWYEPDATIPQDCDPLAIPTWSSQSWNNVPNKIYLFHEFVHAYHYKMGTYGTPTEECKTVGLGAHFNTTYNENKLRCELGQPIRPCYGNICSPVIPGTSIYDAPRCKGGNLERVTSVP